MDEDARLSKTAGAIARPSPTAGGAWGPFVLSVGGAKSADCMVVATGKPCPKPDCAPESVVALADYYEDVVVKRDVGYANTKRALDMTRQFIIDNGLILLGGMAIDMALKAVGRPGIYLNEKLPDYDFLSSDSVGDAGRLARILCRAGLPNVSVINAMHTTTAKVRVNFVNVADIGYCPKVLMKRLPVIEIDGMRMIHPHYQIMDIHVSMSYPFRGMAAPTIFFRWKKDAERYDLMMEAYPVCVECAITVRAPNVRQLAASTGSEPPESRTITYPMTKMRVDATLLDGDCIGGWAALAYYTNKGGAALAPTVDVPTGEPLQVYTDDFERWVARADHGAPIEYFEQRMGHLPRSVMLTIGKQRYEVFDNMGDLLSAEVVGGTSGVGASGVGAAGGVYVANLQQCMLFLLAKVYVYADTSAELTAYCRARYNDAMQMMVAGTVAGVLPSINTFGRVNWDESYVIHRRKFAARLTGEKLTTRDTIDGAYPEPPKCAVSIAFDYAESPYFAISGAKCAPFKAHALPDV